MFMTICPYRFSLRAARMHAINLSFIPAASSRAVERWDTSL